MSDRARSGVAGNARVVDGGVDPVEEIARRIRGELARILDLQREILRAHHRIGLLAVEARALAATAAGSAAERCAAAVGKSRYWLARHAHASAAARLGGLEGLEQLLAQPTADGGVLSPAQYLEYGALRSGAARRAWRLRIYGEASGKTPHEARVRKCEVRPFDDRASGHD
jgi:hypothetical protein